MGNDVFKALGDPTRRRILEMLADKGELTAGEIAAGFDISAPSISHHLGVLKQAGLVEDRHVRQSIVYSLNTTVFQQAVGWFYDILKGGGPDEKA